MSHRIDTFGRRHLPRLLLMLPALCMSGVVVAGENEVKPTLENPTTGFSKTEPLSSEELSRVLDRAIATQKQLDSLTAVFHMTYIENLEGMTPQNVKRKSLPHFAYNNGKMTGTYHWWKEGNLQRLDAKFDIPHDGFALHEYEDRVLTNDAEKQVEYICRTHQAIVVRPGELMAFSPCDMLFPWNRGGFRQIKEDAHYQIQGFKGPKESYLIRVTIPSNADNNVDFVLSAALDYAVTGWAGGVGRIGMGTISYRRDEQGRLIPQQSVLEVVQADGALERRRIMKTQSITLGPPDHKQMEFKLPAKTLVGDNRTELYDGERKAYDVNEDGEWIEAPTN